MWSRVCMSHLNLTLAFVAASHEILQQQLVLGDTLYWLDEVILEGAVQLILLLYFLYKRARVCDC